MAHQTPPPPQPPQQPPWQPPQQPPQQPPWQPTQQPPWQPPKPRNNNRPLVIALAIGIPVVLLIVVVAIVASGGDDSYDVHDPNSVAERFVSAINTGDAAAAEEVLCDGAILTPGSVDEIIAQEPDMRLTEPLEDYVEGMPGSDSVGLEGTVAGEPAVGDVWVGEPEADGPWCILSAMVLPEPE